MAERAAALRDSSLRLFVAAHPPRELLSFLRTRFDEQAWPAHRRASDEQIHLTLCFIGDRRENELGELREGVAQAARGIGPLELRALRLIGLPRRGKSRLVAVELEAPVALYELQRRLVESLLVENPKERARPYLPHLTLCRFREPSRLQLSEEPFARRRSKKRVPRFLIESIRLMRSELRAQGAEHTCLEEFAL